MALAADALTSLVLDASCSTDPDLSPQQYGPAAQGLSYTFECYRPCESAPVHNTSDPMWGFVNWSNPTTHYTTSCVENGTSLTGCFVPFNFHVSGPLTQYDYSDWTAPTYPILYNPAVDNINNVIYSCLKLQL